MPYIVRYNHSYNGWFVETPTGKKMSKKPHKTRKEAIKQKIAIEYSYYSKDKSP